MNQALILTGVSMIGIAAGIVTGIAIVVVAYRCGRWPW
jgi:hypothetical protein